MNINAQIVQSFFEQSKNSICSFIYQCFKNNIEGLGLGHNFYNHYS